MSEDQAIGKARIDVIVDTSQLVIAVDLAKNRTASMSNAAQQEYAKLDRAEKRRTDRLIDQANMLNLTKEQQLAYNIALRTNGALQDELLKKIARNTAAQEANGLSVKQLAAANRQLPMQFTDIFTSLASGQRPMQVFLQQGGQIKDVYGGAGQALKAAGGYLLGLVNPATLSVGAIAALVAAWSEAEKDSQAFGRALLLTGNYARQNVPQLEAMVESLSKLDGVTVGDARSALLAVTESGRIAGDQFERVAAVAARMEASTGQSIDTTIKKFEEIAKKPVETLLKLNETEHFLTAAQLERVRALVEEGREQDAAAEGARIYIDRLENVATAAEAARPHLARMWQEAEKGASKAWQEAKNFAEFMAAAGEKFSEMPWYKRIGPTAVIGAIRALYQAEPVQPAQVPTVAGATDSAEAQKRLEEQEERKRLLDRFHAAETRYLTDSQKRIREKAEVNDLLTKGIISQAEATKRLRQIDDSYAKRSAAGSRTDPTDTLIDRLRKQIALNEEQANSEDKLTATERLMVQVRTELDKLGDKATPQARKLIATLLEQAKASGLNAESALAEAKAKEQLLRLEAQLTAAKENQKRSIEADLASLTRGGDEADKLRRKLDIHRQYEDGLKALRDRGVAEDSKAWNQQKQELQETLDQMLLAERNYQEQRSKIIASSQIGITRAVDNYMSVSRDAATQWENLFTNAFGSAEDALVRFTETGKLSFTDFANSIIKDLTRIAAKEMLVAIFRSFAGGSTGSAGGSGMTGWIGNGYASGGFTGHGGKYKPAGIVHAGEYVINAESTSRLGLGFLDRLNGFADGGYVHPVSHMRAAMTGGSGAANVYVSIENKGDAINVESQQTQRQPDGSLLVRLITSTVAGAIASGTLDDPAGVAWGVRRRGARYG